jgi:hypothetical protein
MKMIRLMIKVTDSLTAGMRQAAYLCRISVAVLCIMTGFTQGANAVTGCAAAKAIDPLTQSVEQTVETQECVTTPCNPGLCTYTLNTGNGIGTFSNCGPFTTCILMGEDPPVSNPQWDEYQQGFQGMGGAMISGRCPPPQASNNYKLSCPAVSPMATSR